MLLTKLKLGISLACLLLISGCSHTIYKTEKLPLPICEPLVQLSAQEFLYLCKTDAGIKPCAKGQEDKFVAVMIMRDSMIKIIKRDAQRKACTASHRAVIESTHVE